MDSRVAPRRRHTEVQTETDGQDWLYPLPAETSLNVSQPTQLHAYSVSHTPPSVSEIFNRAAPFGGGGLERPRVKGLYELF